MIQLPDFIFQVLVPPRGNVIDVLALNPKFSMMVRLLKRSGLADTLQEDGPFTVFALSNDVCVHFYVLDVT